MTTSLEAQLRRYGNYLFQADDAGELRPAPHHRQRQSHPGRLVLACSLALFVAVVVGLVVRAAVEDSAPVTTRPDSEWVRLPDSPLSPRSNAAIGWTGEEILVFGGSTFLCPPGADCTGPEEPPFRDGAAYDPVDGQWRSIADAPVPVGWAQPVTLNGEVFALVPGWQGNDVGGPQVLLRYVPSDDQWRSYEVPGQQVSGLVATDDSVAVLPTGGDGESGILEFHPDTEGWAELPIDPLGPSYDRILAWADDSLVLLAKAQRDVSDPTPSLARAARFDGSAWIEIAGEGPLWTGPPLTDGRRITIPLLGCADGGEVNPFGRCLPAGGVLDVSTSAWGDLPNPPVTGQQAQGGTSAGATTGEHLLLIDLDGWMLDLTTNDWYEIPQLDDLTDGSIERSFAGAGPYGFAFGGSRFPSGSFEGELLGDAWIWLPPVDAPAQ